MIDIHEGIGDGTELDIDEAIPFAGDAALEGAIVLGLKARGHVARDDAFPIDVHGRRDDGACVGHEEGIDALGFLADLGGIAIEGDGTEGEAFRETDREGDFFAFLGFGLVGGDADPFRGADDDFVGHRGIASRFLRGRWGIAGIGGRGIARRPIPARSEEGEGCEESEEIRVSFHGLTPFHCASAGTSIPSKALFVCICMRSPVL